MPFSLQVGWSTARDYYTFLWSPMPENYEPGSTVHRTVVFQGKRTHTRSMKTTIQAQGIPKQLLYFMVHIKTSTFI